MADRQHASLTGASLHEPKGVENANSGEVYLADGLGSGAWGQAPITFTNVIEVTDADDFGPVLAGNKRQPSANTGYYISGEVDMGNTTLEIVNPGVAIIGFNRATDKLTTDSTNPLIESNNVNVVLQGFTLENTNASGTLLGLVNSGTNIAILDKLIFGQCFEIGTVTSFANCVLDNCGLDPIGVNRLIFTGTFGEIILRDSSFQGFTTTMIGLAGATFQFFNCSGCRFFAGDVNATAIAGQPASGGVGILGTISQSAFVGMDNPLGIADIDHADERWFFRSNLGIQDSGFVGYCSMVGNGTETINPGINTWTKVLGTTIASPENERFSMTANNELTYEGLLVRPVEITLNVNGEKAGGTDKVEVTIFKEPVGGGGFTIVNSNAISRTDFSPTARAMTLTLLDTATPGDKYSAYIRNIEDTANMTVQNMQFFIRG